MYCAQHSALLGLHPAPLLHRGSHGGAISHPLLSHPHRGRRCTRSHLSCSASAYLTNRVRVALLPLQWSRMLKFTTPPRAASVKAFARNLSQFLRRPSPQHAGRAPPVFSASLPFCNSAVPCPTSPDDFF